jgi:double-strand break repair protein MRE11
MPDHATLASLVQDNVKVEKLVREFLTAQSLKIFPKAPFGDAVTQFVGKDDKHAMEAFVNDSLSSQIKEIMLRENPDEENLDEVMDELRTKQEALFASGALKTRKKVGKLKPRPQTWDSDMDGEWEDAPGAYEFVDGEDEESTAPAAKRGIAGTIASDDDPFSGPIGVKAPAKKAPAKRAPAKPKAPAKTPARGRKKVLDPSDDEDDDVVMYDKPPPPKSQPKRAAAARGRQTTLNFSQSQAKTQTAKELSDDEISDDDAFEPMVSSSRRR